MVASMHIEHMRDAGSDNVANKEEEEEKEGKQTRRKC